MSCVRLVLRLPSNCGSAGDTNDFALVVVDEACWQRSIEVSEGLTVEALPQLGITGVAAPRRRDVKGAAVADVVMARRKLSEALSALLQGEVTRDALVSLDIDSTFYIDARTSAYSALPVVQLSPGQGLAERRLALERSTQRALGLEAQRRSIDGFAAANYTCPSLRIGMHKSRAFAPQCGAAGRGRP